MLQVAIITILGVALGIAIGVIVRYFGVTPNPLVEKLSALMPGANCGACGFAGCNDYAKAMASGKAKPGMCTSMPAENLHSVCELLGTGAAEHVPMTAVVCCGGDDDHATRRAFYNGVNDCVDAVIVAGGAKGCIYGCMGLGTCARTCPFGAIEILPNHIAFVHSDLCRGCGKCVGVCPRKVIKLVPKSTPVNVLCNSPEKAPVKRKLCVAGCIGCGKCARSAEPGQIVMTGPLAAVNYDNPPSADIAAQCPVGCLKAPLRHLHPAAEKEHAPAAK